MPAAASDIAVADEEQVFACPLLACIGLTTMKATDFEAHVKAHTRKDRSNVRKRAHDMSMQLGFEICTICDWVYDQGHQCKGPVPTKFIPAKAPLHLFEDLSWDAIFSLPSDKRSWAKMPRRCKLLFQEILTNMYWYVSGIDGADERYENSWKALCMLPAMVAQRAQRDESRKILQTRLVAIVDGEEQFWQKRIEQVTALKPRSRMQQKKKTGGIMSEANIMARLASGDISSAMQLTERDSAPVKVTRSVLDQLEAKFPVPEDGDMFHTEQRRVDLLKEILEEATMGPIEVTPLDLQAALSKLRCNRAAGGDGTTPEAIKLIQLEALVGVVSRIVKAEAPKAFLDHLFGGRVAPIPKSDGTPRPVSVAASLSKLISNIFAGKMVAAVQSKCGERQMALGQSGGTELVAAAVMAYFQKFPNGCMVQLDLKNAFHCIDRQKMLELFRQEYPEFWKPVGLVYGRANKMVMPRDGTGKEPEVVDMIKGIRQGDPMSTAIMCAVIDGALREVARKLADAGGALMGFADDQMALGPPEALVEFWEAAKPALAKWGLEVAPAKSKIVSLGSSDDADEVHEVTGLELQQEGMNILGHLIGGDEYVQAQLESDLERLAKTAERLGEMRSTQGAFRLLWQSFTMKAQYRVKLNHSIKVEEYAQGFDKLVADVLAALIGLPVNELSMNQAQLGMKSGGLSLRRLERVVLPARVQTWARVAHVVHGDDNGFRFESNVVGWFEEAFGGELGQMIQRDLDSVRVVYDELSALGKQTPGNAEYQDLYPREVEDLRGNFKNLQKRITEMVDRLAAANLQTGWAASGDVAREQRLMALKQAQAPLSWAWLLALPNGHLHNIKAHMFSNMLAVRIGFEVEHFHIKDDQPFCQCGTRLTIDHAMGCTRIQGSHVYGRHNAITNLATQALSGGQASQVRVEPRGVYLQYGDGGPDMSYRDLQGGLTLVDVSVASARTGVNRPALMTQTLVLAKKRERKKRSENVDRAKANAAAFTPLVFEARGGFGESALKYFKQAARANRTFDSAIQPWEYNCHFQYYTKAVSVALIRGSAQNLALAFKLSR